LVAAFLAGFLVDETLLAEDWAAAGETEGKLKSVASTAIRIRRIGVRTDGKR
jgi:hypothetical protein